MPSVSPLKFRPACLLVFVCEEAAFWLPPFRLFPVLFRLPRAPVSRREFACVFAVVTADVRVLPEVEAASVMLVLVNLSCLSSLSY